MHPRNVVLLQSDREIAQSLAFALSKSFHSVHQVETMDELRNSVGKHRAKLAILDLEKVSLSEVERLATEFPAFSIVCTHRCADEEMWSSALKSGARDVYFSDDVQGIVQAAVADQAETRSAAA